MSDDVNVVQNEPNTVHKVLKILKNIGKWFCRVLLTILVVVSGWLCIDKFIIGSPIPSMFGYSSLMVSTGSMSGTLEKGDLIIIKDTGDYKIGDMVTFFQPGDDIPTTHRIYYIDEDGKWVTKGDANDSFDPVHITDEDIYGEVVAVIPKVGIFVGWVTDGGGYIFLIGAALIVLMGVVILKSDGSSEVEPVTEDPVNDEPNTDTPVTETPVTEEETPNTEE